LFAGLLGLVVGAWAVALSAGTTTSVSAGGITAVKVARDSNLVSTASTTFVNIPGATITMTVPPKSRALILARFSATSECDGVPNNGCEVRVVINNIEAQPAGINASVFDSGTSADTGDSREAHMIERSAGPLPAGNYVVKAQMAVPNNEVSLVLANWNLTVERAKI
jgi:hypothetical protein